MPVDGQSGRYGDDPGPRGDRPDALPERAGTSGDEAGAATRLAETRSRSEYYRALRAADGYPVPGDHPPDAARGTGAACVVDEAAVTQAAGGTDASAVTEAARGTSTKRSRWDAPDLEGHPDRPPPDSFRLLPERAAHILDGDTTGGGHRHGTGRAGKTEFPADWDDRKIMENVVSVARSPDSAELQRNGRWRAEGSRDEVRLAVVIRPDGRIWAAYPQPGSPGVTQNPRDR